MVVILIIIAVLTAASIIAFGITMSIVWLCEPVRIGIRSPLDDIITWIDLTPNMLVSFVDNFNENILERLLLPIVWIIVLLLLSCYFTMIIIYVMLLYILVSLKRWLLFVKNG